MRHSRYYHALAFLAVIALSWSLLAITVADALPLGDGASPSVFGLDSTEHKTDGGKQLLPLAAGTSAPVAPISTQNPTIPSQKPTSPAATTQKVTLPSPQPQPQQPQPQPQPHPQPHPQPNSAPVPAKVPTLSTARAPSGTAGPLALPDGTTSSPTPAGSSMPGDETTVPTKVSEKVLIGLGAAGGLLVCMLGMIALCRHRRKKNLAEALLRQTAQFNHNNPYAKLSEPAMGAKDIKSASPTKPIGTYSVIAMYTPALADEIEIHVGDSVTILQEYDDGWCLGMNNSRSGIEGVFPRHCLEGQYGNAGPGYYPPNASFKGMANKRMSSIPAGGWNNVNIGYNGGGGRGHGYGNFRPNPNPVPQYGGYNGRY